MLLPTDEQIGKKKTAKASTVVSQRTGKLTVCERLVTQILSLKETNKQGYGKGL